MDIERGEIKVPRPQGALWEKRRKAVFKRDGNICFYCGKPAVKPVVAHLISLANGMDLRVSTGSLDHPLNAFLENLATSCARDNYLAGNLDIPAARRKVARVKGTPLYDGPVPDLTRVQTALDALIETSRGYKPKPATPRKEAKPLTTTNPRFRTIAEYIKANEYPVGSGKLNKAEVKELWNMAGELACECGPADGSRCFMCLPV